MQGTIDLHLHSSASQSSAGFFSGKLGMQESYQAPLTLYHRLKARGMSLVTLTDHNAIAGCLEIGHLPDVFVSEEITVAFPEDNCQLHVIALNITEAHHREIQPLRKNIYELVDYLQYQQIEHILAHPLYDMNGTLDRTHIERCLLLFDNWEILNGTRSRLSRNLTLQIVQRTTATDLERYANQYGFNKRQRATIAMTGGSDDHGGIDVGQTFTRFAGESCDDLLQSLRLATTEPAGQPGSAERLSHMVMGITYQWMQERGAAYPLLDALFGQEQRLSWPQRIFGGARLGKFIQQVCGRDYDLANERHQLIHSFTTQFFPYLIGELRHQKNGDMEQLAMILGKIVLSAVPTAFYLSTYWQRAIEKRRSRQIFQALTGGAKHREGKVAYFTDTIDDINGVALTSRKLLALCQRHKYNMTFLTCGTTLLPETPHRYQFAALFSFPLPEYPELTLNIPHFLDLLEYVDQENFDVIYAATPGILGLYAFAIASILKIPYVTTFHTDFPAYIGRYTGDHLCERLLWSAYAVLCNQADRVLAPSDTYAKVLRSNGVKRKRIHVFRRGVNTELFHPDKRQKDFWQQFDATYQGEPVILYVGRVAREKNLEVWLQTHELWQQTQRTAKFVIIGDGPLLKEIKQRYPAVITPGYLRGEMLAAAYASAQVFFFPSTTETFGNVILEAQASGLPVVVAAEGACQENMMHGVTGTVIRDQNPFSYRNALQNILNQPDVARSMALQGRSFACSRNEEKLLKEMITLFSLGRIATQE
ncbi:glycosyltransferase [Chrysiogenes arsenatis]|uniref:glycosyltransferase n=1 Tax=Chrysiogenes arsenatis TaxID=309797 RepID=UPI0003F835C9|nr:glycosyltransferase [Chrysiogenes arsenatis]